MSLELWIAGGILAIGIILFFYFSNREQYRRHESVSHYTRKRDELTLPQEEEEQVSQDEEEQDEEEEEEEEETASYGGGTSIGSIAFWIALVTGLIVMFIVFKNAGVFTSNVNSSNSLDYQTVVVEGMGDVGNAVAEWLNLIVLLVVIGFIVGIFTKMANLFGAESSYSPSERKKAKPQRHAHSAVKHYEGVRDALSKPRLKR